MEKITTELQRNKRWGQVRHSSLAVDQRLIPLFGHTHAEDQHAIACVQCHRALDMIGRRELEHVVDEAVVAQHSSGEGATGTHEVDGISRAEELVEAVADGLQERQEAWGCRRCK